MANQLELDALKAGMAQLKTRCLKLESDVAELKEENAAMASILDAMTKPEDVEEVKETPKLSDLVPPKPTKSTRK